MPEQNLDSLENDAPLSEIFLSDSSELSEEDGLIYKDILREGKWAYRPINGKPTRVPMNIVPGKGTNETDVGMDDIIESFEDGAIDHVTVPTSHKDAPHENTGYVRKLRKVLKNGKTSLQAGIEFTEPDIKAKALRGTIAGTSAGLLHDYIKKDSGKQYKIALGHTALTNKPWVNGMDPFGVALSENLSDDEIDSLMLEEVVWDSEKSHNGLRDRFSSALSKDHPGHFVLDISDKKALVTRFSSEGPAKDENFVVPYKDKEEGIQISDQNKWIAAEKEWVKTALADVDYDALRKDFDGESQGDPSEESATKGVVENDIKGETDMSDTPKEETAGTGANDNPAPETSNFSEEDVNTLVETKTTKLSTELAESREEVEALRKKVHEAEVEKQITKLSDDGLNKYPGLLKEIRNVKLADTGKNVLNLSEEVDGEAVETELSVSGAVDRIINALPKDETSGKFSLLSEEILVTDDHGRSPSTPEVKEFDEEAFAAQQKQLGREYIPIDGGK